MRFLFTLIALAAIQVGYAQKITVKGQLLDSASAPLPSATVLLLNPVDSSLVNFGVSNAQGFFELKNVNRREYLFKVTFVGYVPVTRRVTPSDTDLVVDLGAIKMEVDTRQLDEVVVRAERAPVVVKKDTIEFNATAFKTQPNANVEDLLKKLPGVEVDNDGNIDAQGERVQRVTVDGREFFGRDPKIATRNLPADAVDKVQIFDKKSDQSAFTGIDDGQREKTVNLELKEEKRNGMFGNVTGGIGTDERFSAKASLNKFSKSRQMSLLGMANNVNEQGFSIDEYMNFSGGSQQMVSGGGGGMRIQINGDNAAIPLNQGGRNNGIMTSYAGGINFNNDFTKKTRLSSNYFVNYLDHDLLQSTERENFLPSGSLTFNQNSRQSSSNDNHRVNLILDHEIDSSNSIKLTNAFSFNQTDSEQISTSETRNREGEVQNESDQVTSSNGSTLRLNSDLLLRHRFRTKGRTLSANINFGVSNTARDGLQYSDNRYYVGNTPDKTINQRTSQITNNTTYGTTLSYTEPLGNRKYLEINYSISKNQNEVVRGVFDRLEEGEVKNSTLSNEYISNYQYQRGGLNIRMNRKNFNVTVGSSLQYTHLTGDLISLNAEVDRTFKNVLPVARFNYDFSSTKHLRFDYETSVQEPTIQQLQPVVDNSDPLNLYVGNPDLRPAYQQSWRVSFTTFSPVSFISWFTFVDVDYITNAITSAQNFDEDFVRTTKPTNVDNSVNIRGNSSFSFPINKISSRVNITGNYRNSKSISLLNDEPNKTIQNTFGGNIRYNYRYKEIVDLTLSSRISYQTTRYELNQPDQTYLNQTHSVESNITFLKNYQFTTGFDYQIYESQTSDFNQTIPFLNMAISRFLLKNKAGELKLSVNNLLDRNLGVSQTATSNYFQIQTINSLGRYFMVSFTYAINKHLNPMGMRGGRGFRMIRQ
jgi:hypothetical protein